MAAVDTYWDGVAAILGLTPTQVTALKALAPPWSDLQYSNPALAQGVVAATAALGAFKDGLAASVVTGPAATTENRLAQWDATARKLKDGRAIGVASGAAIPDRDAADTRYARYDANLAFTIGNPRIRGGSHAGDLTVMADPTGAQQGAFINLYGKDASGGVGGRTVIGHDNQATATFNADGIVNFAAACTFNGDINTNTGFVYTSSVIIRRSSYPLIDIRDNSAPTDMKQWRMFAAPDGGFSVVAVDDAQSNSVVGFYLTRAGVNPSSMYVNAHLSPAGDNQRNLGGPSNRWATVYAVTGTINTSDATEKTLVDDGLLTPAGLLTPLGLAILARVKICAYQWNDAIAQKGAEHARIHHGMIAQAWGEAFEAEGLDPARFALWCADPVLQRVETPIVRQWPKTEMVDGPEVIEIIAGIPTLVPGPQVERPVGAMVDVQRNGAVVMLPAVVEMGEEGPVEIVPSRPLQHFVQDLEDYDDVEVTFVESGAVRYGLRYDLAVQLLLAEGRTRLAALEARVAGLEGA